MHAMATRTVTKTGFDVLDISLEWIEALRPVVQRIQLCDADLARQLRKAASSVPLNIGEGRRREGKDRSHHWRIAAGSADEAQCCLRVARAWGHVKASDLAPVLELSDRILAMLWRLTH